MLFLVFHIGDERFALQAGVIEEITPLVQLGKLSKTPEYVAGVLDYRGILIPVIDLCRLIQNRPSIQKVSTRIIVIRFTDAAGESRLLGLIAERVNDTFVTDLRNFTEHGIEILDTPALGKVMYDDSGVIQLLDAGQLLSEKATALLFGRNHAATTETGVSHGAG